MFSKNGYDWKYYFIKIVSSCKNSQQWHLLATILNSLCVLINVRRRAGLEGGYSSILLRFRD